MLSIRSLYLGAVVLFAVAGGACGGETSPGEPDAGPMLDADVRATFNLTWTIADDGTGAPLTCADVAATAVSARLLLEDSLSGVPVSFPCDSGSGTTPPLEPGEYDVTFRLVGSAGELAEVETQMTLTPSGISNASTEFSVVPRGGFAFTLDALAGAGNCASVDQEGAGINQVQLEFLDNNSPAGCLPATFSIDGQTYETTCNGEVFDGCIENDTVVTVTDVASGVRRLAVTGLRAGELACYRSSSLFSVPGSNLSAEVGVIPLALQPVAGCAPETE